MGGTPIVAVNLLCWPRDTLPMELLRGGLALAREAQCPVAGGHSDDPEPKYGMTVTGLAHLDLLLRNDIWATRHATYRSPSRSVSAYSTRTRESAAGGFVRGGTRSNLEWVHAHTTWRSVAEMERLLLADAQTPGGLQVVGEVPGGMIIGELVPSGDSALVVG